MRQVQEQDDDDLNFGTSWSFCNEVMINGPNESSHFNSFYALLNLGNHYSFVFCLSFTYSYQLSGKTQLRLKEYCHKDLARNLLCRRILFPFVSSYSSFVCLCPPVSLHSSSSLSISISILNPFLRI